MAGSKRLSDVVIRQAKPSEGGKPRKLTDGLGLFLIVTSTRKSWRYDYQYQGKRRSMGIGAYPAVSLTKARQIHTRAREDLRAEGIDPVQARQGRTLEEARREHNALQEIAQEWIGRQSKWKDSHRSKVALRLNNDVYPIIGARPIAENTT